MSQPETASTATVDDLPPISWRRNLYALWIAQTLAIIGFTLRDAYLPFFIKDLGSGTTESAVLWSGLVQAGGAGVMTIAAPLWGIFADRKGRKPMVLRAMFAATLTVGLMGLATQPWHLVALRMFEGAFTGTVAASTALVAASVPKDRLGYSLGLLQTAVFSGASLGPFFGGMLADQIGYRATFGVSAGVLASAGIIVAIFVQERFVPAPRGAERGMDAVRASKTWLVTPVMMMMVTVLFIVRFAQMGVRPSLPLYIESLAHTSEARAASLAGLALGLLGVTSAISSVVLGRRGDRIGHRRILFFSVLGAGLIYLPMAFVNAPWQLIVLQGMFGVFAGGMIPAANAIVASVTPPERRGAIFGVTAAAMSLGGFFGPLAIATVTAAFGFPVTYILVGIPMIILAAVLLRFGRNVGDPSDEAMPAAA